MKTPMEELIQWTIENAFTVTDQAGTTYIAIDHEEMMTHFDELVEKEKQMVVDAVIWFDDTDRRPAEIEKSAIEYYNEKFSK